MARCEDCIHEKVCLHRANIQTDTYAYMGVTYDTEKCKHYCTANVAPKSEVAREIFEEIKKYLTPHNIGVFNSIYVSNVIYELKKKYTEEKE